MHWINSTEITFVLFKISSLAIRMSIIKLTETSLFAHNMLNVYVLLHISMTTFDLTSWQYYKTLSTYLTGFLGLTNCLLNLLLKQRLKFRYCVSILCNIPHLTEHYLRADVVCFGRAMFMRSCDMQMSSCCYL